jgi:hypothetical protein
VALNESDPSVRLKLATLEAAMPARDAIVFGDMWVVEGGYTLRCLELGCERATLIDSFETDGWLETRRANPTLNFYKGDFSDPLFMSSLRERHEIGVAFDVLLHQAPLVHTLHLMAERVDRALCIVQPMLREQELPNTLVYLPGTTAPAELHPLEPGDAVASMFSVREPNPAHWIWAMTPSFLTSALAGEGFDVTWSQQLDEGIPNERWMWWGCVAERTDEPIVHWSAHYKEPLLRSAS